MPSYSENLTKTKTLPGITTLDKCPSNLFHLLDLQDIRWQKFTDNSTFPKQNRDFNPTHPADDQILKLYSKCLENGILATWRRQPIRDDDEDNSNDDNHMGGPTSSSSSNKYKKNLFARVNRNKEIWLFWWRYDEELIEEIMKDYVELKNFYPKTQDWNNTNDGVFVSYDVRCLIFKAIHNQIEHRLTNYAGYIRIGRWFIKPTRRQETEKTSLIAELKSIGNSILDELLKKLLSDSWNSKISLSFSFFLHAYSNVIMTVETCQHDELVAVSAELISVLSQGGYGGFTGHTKSTIEKLKKYGNISFPLQVVLAPYGFRGSLTGESYAKYDGNSKTILSDWSLFYNVKHGIQSKFSGRKNILDKGYNKSETNSYGIEKEDDNLPSVMEVIVGGVRMKYPTHLILIEKHLDEIIVKIDQENSSLETNPACSRDDLANKNSETVEELNMTEADDKLSHNNKTLVNEVLQSTWQYSTRALITSEKVHASNAIFDQKVEKATVENLAQPFHKKQPTEQKEDSAEQHPTIKTHAPPVAQNLPQMPNPEIDAPLDTLMDKPVEPVLDPTPETIKSPTITSPKVFYKKKTAKTAYEILLGKNNEEDEMVENPEPNFEFPSMNLQLDPLEINEDASVDLGIDSPGENQPEKVEENLPNLDSAPVESTVDEIKLEMKPPLPVKSSDKETSEITIKQEAVLPTNYKKRKDLGESGIKQNMSKFLRAKNVQIGTSRKRPHEDTMVQKKKVNNKLSENLNAYSPDAGIFDSNPITPEVQSFKYPKLEDELSPEKLGIPEEFNNVEEYAVYLTHQIKQSHRPETLLSESYQPLELEKPPANVFTYNPQQTYLQAYASHLDFNAPMNYNLPPVKSNIDNSPSKTSKFDPNPKSVKMPSYLPSPRNPNLNSPATGSLDKDSLNRDSRLDRPPGSNLGRQPKTPGSVNPGSVAPPSSVPPHNPSSVNPGSVSRSRRNFLSDNPPGSVLSQNSPNITRSNRGMINPKTPASVAYPNSVLTPGKCGLATPGQPPSTIDPFSYPKIEGSSISSIPNRIKRLQHFDEVNSLAFNLYLSDSLLNVFRDHCFDQCPVCVCNLDKGFPLTGFDHDLLGRYSEDNKSEEDENFEECTCGFSSLRNRQVGFSTGLLLEDELEVLTTSKLEHQRKIIALRKNLPAMDDEFNEDRLKKLNFKITNISNFSKSYHECNILFSSSFVWMLGNLKDTVMSSKYTSSIEKRGHYQNEKSNSTSQEEAHSKNAKGQNSQSNSQCHHKKLGQSVKPPKSKGDSKNQKDKNSSKNNTEKRRNFIAEHDIYLAFIKAQINARTYLDINSSIRMADEALHDKNKDKWDLVSTIIHPWNYSSKVLPSPSSIKISVQSCSTEIKVVQLLKALGNLLQDAIQKRNFGQNFTQHKTIQGPLTWAEFITMGDKNEIKALPIPRLVTKQINVGQHSIYDNTNLSKNPNLIYNNNLRKFNLGNEMSPNGISFWEQLGLTPKNSSQDVVYVYLCPENLEHLAKNFMDKLSSFYESNELGSHVPLVRHEVKPGTTHKNTEKTVDYFKFLVDRVRQNLETLEQSRCSNL